MAEAKPKPEPAAKPKPEPVADITLAGRISAQLAQLKHSHAQLSEQLMGISNQIYILEHILETEPDPTPAPEPPNTI